MQKGIGYGPISPEMTSSGLIFRPSDNEHGFDVSASFTHNWLSCQSLQFNPDFDACTLACELLIQGQSLLHRPAYQLNNLLPFGNLADRWPRWWITVPWFMARIVATLSGGLVRIRVSEIFLPCFRM